MNKATYWLTLMALIMSLLANLYWGWYLYPAWYPKEINIPNTLQINNFCVANGYEYGWLSSSSCGIDEVNCHKKIFDVEKNMCIKWDAERK